MLTLAVKNTADTVDIRAAAVLIIPLGCSMSFLHRDQH